MNIYIYLVIVLATITFFGGLSYYRYLRFKTKVKQMEMRAKFQCEVNDLYYDYLKMVNEEALTKRYPLTASFLGRIPKIFIHLNTGKGGPSYRLNLEKINNDDETYRRVNADFVGFMKELNCAPKKVQILVRREFDVMDQMMRLSDPTFYRILSIASRTASLATALTSLFERLAYGFRFVSDQFITIYELLFKYQHNEDYSYGTRCTTN